MAGRPLRLTVNFRGIEQSVGGSSFCLHCYWLHLCILSPSILSASVSSCLVCPLLVLFLAGSCSHLHPHPLILMHFFDRSKPPASSLHFSFLLLFFLKCGHLTNTKGNRLLLVVMVTTSDVQMKPLPLSFSLFSNIFSFVL